MLPTAVSDDIEAGVTTPIGLDTGFTMPSSDPAAGLKAETLGGLGVDAALCLELGLDDNMVKFDVCIANPADAGHAGGLPQSSKLPAELAPWLVNNGPPVDGARCCCC